MRTEDHIVLVILREEQAFGEIVRQDADRALIKYELDGDQLTGWFSGDEYIAWQNIYFEHFDDGDE